MSIVYLATPYSHPDRGIRVMRFEHVNRVAAKLMRDGMHIFSPISHTHPIAEAGDLPKGWEFWAEYDRRILAVCERVIVLMQDGWKESKGVAAELKIAEELGLPVEYLNAYEGCQA